MCQKDDAISNEIDAWDRFWEVIITFLGTFFAAYTIAKDYVEMVEKQPGDFYKILIAAMIIWLVLMSLLLLIGFLIFKLFRRLKVF